jgi:hypothetical protein
MLIAYSGWAETVQSRTYNSERIWGKLYSLIGIQEDRKPLTIDLLSFEIFPNPAKSYLAIRLPSTADRQAIKIFDVSGKLVKVIDKVTSAQEHKQEMKISLKGINPGIYFVQSGWESITKKLVITK